MQKDHHHDFCDFICVVELGLDYTGVYVWIRKAINSMNRKLHVSENSTGRLKVEEMLWILGRVGMLYYLMAVSEKKPCESFLSNSSYFLGKEVLVSSFDKYSSVRLSISLLLLSDLTVSCMSQYSANVLFLNCILQTLRQVMI